MMLVYLAAFARGILVIYLALRLYQERRWLRGANARRKRIGRALAKQQRLNDTLDRINKNLLADNCRLLEDAKKYEKLYRALAAELTDEVLTAQDRETVTKGLTRKL